jgi:hypothetical protein
VSCRFRALSLQKIELNNGASVITKKIINKKLDFQQITLNKMKIYNYLILLIMLQSFLLVAQTGLVPKNLMNPQF